MWQVHSLYGRYIMLHVMGNICKTGPCVTYRKFWRPQKPLPLKLCEWTHLVHVIQTLLGNIFCCGYIVEIKKDILLVDLFYLLILYTSKLLTMISSIRGRGAWYCFITPTSYALYGQSWGTGGPNPIKYLKFCCFKAPFFLLLQPTQFLQKGITDSSYSNG